MASGAAPQDGEMGIEEEGFICRHEMFACSLCGLPVKRGERIYPGNLPFRTGSLSSTAPNF